MAIRPPLSKKLFPVDRVGKKVQSGGRDFSSFLPNSILYKLECTGRGVKKKNSFENMKKKESHSALFSPTGWWTGNIFLFKGGLRMPPLCFLL